MDKAEDLARERAKELFGCEYVNVQPHSGAQANMAVQVCGAGARGYGYGYEPGSRRTSDPWKPCELFRKIFSHCAYGVNDEGFIDYDNVMQIAMECKPKMIILYVYLLCESH